MEIDLAIARKSPEDMEAEETCMDPKIEILN
jgi:hypothetical protein